MLKKILPLLLCSLLLLSALSGCAPASAPAPEQAAPQTQTPEAPAQAPAETAPDADTVIQDGSVLGTAAVVVTMQMADIPMSITTDGVTTMTSEVDYPCVEIPGNDAAAKAINAEYAEEVAEHKEDIAQMAQESADDYNSGDEARKANFPSYFYDCTHTVVRADAKVLSILEEDLIFLGGAHPNGERRAKTFDVATGRELELEDIVTVSEDEVEIFAREFLIGQLKAGDYGLFDDYENYLDDLVEDDSWYFSESGVTFIVNPYIVTPHAAGILEFMLPYAEFTMLKPEYIPAA